MKLIDKVKEYLKSELGLDEEEVLPLISTARESLREDLRKLEKSLENGNLEDFAKVAHTVKGVLLNLGLEEEAGFAKELELKARAGENTEVLKEGLLKLTSRVKELT